MGGFNCFFGTIAHAFHTAFAIESPEWAIVFFNYCMNRAIVNANTTIITSI